MIILRPRRLLRPYWNPPVRFRWWLVEVGPPGWVGPLDIVVVMGGGDKTSLAAAFEAAGCPLVVGPADSVLARESASSATTLLPTTTGDAAAAIVALGPERSSAPGERRTIATAMDEVALESSMVDATQNAARPWRLSYRCPAAGLGWFDPRRAGQPPRCGGPAFGERARRTFGGRRRAGPAPDRGAASGPVRRPVRGVGERPPSRPGARGRRPGRRARRGGA